MTANIAQQLRLRPDEWQSGDIYWIVDVAGEPNAIAGALMELAQKQFKGQPVKVVMPDANGKPFINELQEMFARASVADPREQ